MQIKAPRLLINRHGVYYFRLKSDGVEKRISLRTKCSLTANILDLMFRKVASVDLWLAEHENTDYNKQRAIRSFKARQVSKSHVSADIDINAITKKLLTDYKSLLGSGVDPQSTQTIDNKIESLSDFMNYTIGHGLYTLSPDNPTDGLRIQNKKARIANTKS